MALIFSVAMLWIPEAEIVRATGHSKIVSAMQQHSPLLAALFARYGGLALTLLGALFLVAVRLWGAAVATFFEHSFGLVSKKLGAAIGEKIRTFHSGLDTMRSFRTLQLPPVSPLACGCSLPCLTLHAVELLQPARN